MGIRYIGGFGKAYWVSYKDIQDFEIVEESLEASTIEHMNADHQSSICKYINSEDESASIIVDSLGFYVKGNMLYRVMFGNKNPVLTAEQMKAFINLSDKRPFIRRLSYAAFLPLTTVSRIPAVPAKYLFSNKLVAISFIPSVN